MYGLGQSVRYCLGPSVRFGPDCTVLTGIDQDCTVLTRSVRYRLGMPDCTVSIRQARLYNVVRQARLYGLVHRANLYGYGQTVLLPKVMASLYGYPLLYTVWYGYPLLYTVWYGNTRLYTVWYGNTR